MKNVSFGSFLFLCVVMLFSGSHLLLAKMTRFDMKDLGQRNLLVVTSEAPLEKTVALTHYLSSSIEVDPEAISELKANFEVDVRTLDSGTEMKNVQVREQLLGSQEFPTVTATVNAQLGKLKLKLIDGKPVNVRVDALIKIKNVAKAIPVNLRLTYFKESEQTRQRMTGNLLKVSATAEIDLGAFGILIPNGYSTTLSRYAQVSLDALGSDRLPAENSPVPEGIKKK